MQHTDIDHLHSTIIFCNMQHTVMDHLYSTIIFCNMQHTVMDHLYSTIIFCNMKHTVIDHLYNTIIFCNMQHTVMEHLYTVPIKTTLSDARTTHYVALLNHLTNRTRWVLKDLDPTNDLTSLRIRSKKHEIIVVPGR
ncbi:unnamed protein product [Timema podura]|uniref:Roadblock/LAMTOR2 domain-containing protein n=1 Tax=Timema podura TaxID=61482 RepID=A0ABN7NTL3_TIMPD|nr:unnamed protein product [Timema podura]